MPGLGYNDGILIRILCPTSSHLPKCIIILLLKHHSKGLPGETNLILLIFCYGGAQKELFCTRCLW